MNNNLIKRIKENIAAIENKLNEDCKLIIVSKMRSIEEISAAYDLGYRNFAENKVQLLLQRRELLPKDIHWHLIGHLQTNKVKQIVSFVHCVHSVDSLKLILEIEKQAMKINRTVNVLLQVFIAQEETKYGLSEKELEEILILYRNRRFEHVRIIGFMGMASQTDNQEQIKGEFDLIRNLYLNYKKEFTELQELCIGMSNDYHLAQMMGSTMVRIGTAVFESKVH